MDPLRQPTPGPEASPAAVRDPPHGAEVRPPSIRERWLASGLWLAPRVLQRALRVVGLEWTRVLLFERRSPAPAAALDRLALFCRPGELPWDEPLIAPGPAVDRLGAGDRLLALRDGSGRLVCRGYLAAGRPVHVREVDRFLPLSDGGAWLYDCATVPDQRGRGLFPQLLAAAAALHLGEGGRRLLVGALDWNRASVRAFRKAGFAPCGSMTRAGRRR